MHGPGTVINVANLLSAVLFAVGSAFLPVELISTEKTEQALRFFYFFFFFCRGY